jgi:hypothetical protein
MTDEAGAEKEVALAVARVEEMISAGEAELIDVRRQHGALRSAGIDGHVAESGRAEWRAGPSFPSSSPR